MRPATPTVPHPLTSVRARRGLDVSALAALFVLTLRQHVRGRRLLVLSLLFLLPSILATLVRLAPHPPPAGHLEFALVFNLIPHALAPLTALLYAAGIIQDEVEEQTLTYLLLRPLPRWALYITKLAATMLTTAVLVGAFTILTYVVIYWTSADLWRNMPLDRALKAAALLSLALATYCAVFAVVSLFTRRALFAGLAYIVAFEGLLASFESVVRRLTVMYYFRVLAVRWLDPPDARSWTLDLAAAPSARECVWTLLGATAILTVLGAVKMNRAEFRMKTPEGS